MEQEFTRPAAREFGVLLALLLPVYLFSLHQSWWIRTAGHLYLAGLCVYMSFFSPHLKWDEASRKSLRELWILVPWSLAVIWIVTPIGPLGKTLGQILIGCTVFFILVISPLRHGDTPEDWGIGSPRAFFRGLFTGPGASKRLFFWLFGNLVLVLLAFWGAETLNEVYQGFCRRSFGLRYSQAFSLPTLVLTTLVLANFFAGIFRYDNAAAAARILGWYFLGAATLFFVAGYVYVYLVNGGWVEVLWVKGSRRIATYLLWGTLQELLFLSYFNTRLRKSMTSPWLSALLTAVLFSIYHVPAYVLMSLCFFVGIIWALVFQAAPNLLLMGITHGISGGFASAFEVKGMVMFKIRGRVGPFAGY
jgi:hypothetical protein